MTLGLAHGAHGTVACASTPSSHAPRCCSEGAVVLVGDRLTPDMIESMEAMVEAVVALCAVRSRAAAARTRVSLDLIDELGLEVRALDGTAVEGAGA